MKRFISLAIMMAIVIGLLPAAHGTEGELTLRKIPMEEVELTCEELGLQVTWYPEYEGLMRRYGTGQMLLVEGGKSYLCKLNGDVKLAGPFDAFGEFNKDGLAPACQNGRWGMVDMNGNTVVDFIYAGQYEAELAGETYPVFKGKNGKDAPPYALFTKLGTQLTEYKYQGHDRFVNGFCMVTADGKGWGYLDVNGKEITALEFRHEALGTAKFSGDDDYGIFDENGYAIVCTDEGFNIIDKYHGWGLMGTPLPKKPWRAGHGLWGCVDAESGKVGFVDEGMFTVIRPRFDDRTTPKGYQEAYWFDDNGLADVYENNEYFTIDLNGNRVDRSTYAYTPTGEDALHEGLRRVQTGENGPWAFVNEVGETVIPAIFDAVGYFDCGYASVLVDGVFGLLRNPLLTVGKTEASTADITFTDVPAGSWFEKGVMTCAQSGVMVGVGENIFSPNATLTDAECAMLAYRIYDQAHGGDGSLMKMPEGYGYIKLVSEDGSYVHEGYAGDGDVWGTQIVFYNSHGYRLRPYGEEKLGPATVTFGGKEYRGEVKDGSRGSGRYPSDHFPYFEPEDSTLNDLIMKAYRIPPPDRWWANLVYTIWEKGWEDIFPYIIYGREAWRSSFAELLGDVTDLPKRFDVPPIPDGGERGVGTYYDQVYEMYEAGVIGGVDAYGTFESSKTLTRAEAAVMVARVLDESQRLTAPPRPMPTEGEGYTLTYLRDGMFADLYRLNDTYPYCVVGEFAEGSTYAAPVGLLTLEGEYTPWSEEMEKQVKVPYGWRDWGGLWTENGGYYRWSDGTPATEKFDWCGKIGHDGRGFVQKDGKLYCIQFDLTAEKAVLRPERPTVPTDAAEGTEYLYDFLFRERYGAKVDKTYTFMVLNEESGSVDYYTLLMPVEGALEGAVAESIDGDGMTPYQLKRYKQDGPDGSLVVGVHAYPLDEVEYISYLWTDRPEVWTDWYIGVGESEEDLLWSYWGRANLRLIKKEKAELDWMSAHSTWDFDELYVWQPFTPENNDVRDITFYMKDRKVAAIEMTVPYELRYVYGHDAEAELQRADERRQGL